MGNAKLLVLGIGTTAGVFAGTRCCWWPSGMTHQPAPLWGIDQRLKRFGAMAAMVLSMC